MRNNIRHYLYYRCNIRFFLFPYRISFVQEEPHAPAVQAARHLCARTQTRIHWTGKRLLHLDRVQRHMEDHIQIRCRSDYKPVPRHSQHEFIVDLQICKCGLSYVIDDRCLIIVIIYNYFCSVAEPTNWFNFRFSWSRSPCRPWIAVLTSPTTWIIWRASSYTANLLLRSTASPTNWAMRLMHSSFNDCFSAGGSQCQSKHLWIVVGQPSLNRKKKKKVQNIF